MRDAGTSHHPDARRSGSLWLARATPVGSDPFPERTPFDEIVVGAGLAGLTTAVLLQRLGRRVVVVEARTVGAVATGNTTAKLSALQGGHLQKVRSHNTARVTDAYAASALAGCAWLLDFAESAGVPVERTTSYTFASTEAGRDALDREYEVSRAHGLAVRRVENLDVPFPAHGAIALEDQAQFDPMDVLAALAAEFRAGGGTLVEDARVTRVRASAPAVVVTTKGELRGDRVYLTTGTPILDRGLYFAKLTAHRSYALSFDGVADVPDGMFLSVDEPTRSIRSTPGRDGAGRSLLVGGNGHVVGRERSAAALVDDLIDWTERYFPGATLTHSWSAQDYRAPHRVPFVGWLPRGRGRIFIATGFDKWGMSGAVSAALTLVGDVSNTTPEWARVLHHRPTLPVVVAEGIGSGVAVGAWAARGWWGALTGPDLGASSVRPPLDGDGVVGRIGVRPTAVSTVDGVTCAVSAVCPHLGGVVGWNDSERS